MNMLERLMTLSESDYSRRKNIVDVLRVRNCHKILLLAMDETGVADFLRRPGPFTLFAPTDEAFEKVPRFAGLLDDTKLLKSVLYRHICAGRFDLQSLNGVAKLRPIEGDAIDTGVREIVIQDARIVDANLMAWNGIAHSIDKVLIRDNYSWLREAGTALEEAVKAGGEKADAWMRTGTQRLEDAITKTLKS